MPPKAKQGGGEHKNKSWLPGERLSSKQLGLLILGIAVLLAGGMDLYRGLTQTQADREAAYLEPLYELGSQLPPKAAGAVFRSVDEVNNVAKLARVAADELEDLDAEGLPTVTTACAVVVTDVANALAAFLGSNPRSSIGEYEAVVRAAMGGADIALNCIADEAHVALLFVAAEATRAWAALAGAEKDTERERSLLLRRAALLEQAVAVQAENPAVRTAYGAALVGLQRYTEARQQLDNVLRKHPSYPHRGWVEWLDAVAITEGDTGDYDAVGEMREFAKAHRESDAPQFETLGFTVPLIEPRVLAHLRDRA